jgi:hypothetical protein
MNQEKKEGTSHIDAKNAEILLAIDDMNEIMLIAETLAKHTRQIEIKLAKRIDKIESYISKFKKEISILKNK